MHKSFRSKGQFFIISAVIIGSMIALVTQYLSDYGKVDLTKTRDFYELQNLKYTKDMLTKTLDASSCPNYEEDLVFAENFLRDQLSKKGIKFDASHSVNCPSVRVVFNLTSSRFFSTTDFRYP